MNRKHLLSATKSVRLELEMVNDKKKFHPKKFLENEHFTASSFAKKCLPS